MQEEEEEKEARRSRSRLLRHGAGVSLEAGAVSHRLFFPWSLAPALSRLISC